MYWLIQKTLKENRYQEFTDNAYKLGCKVIQCNVFPFVDKFFDIDVFPEHIDTAPELILPTDEPIVMIGSVMTSRITFERNIMPGGFLTPNSDFPIWSQAYGLDNILNGDTISGKLSEIQVPDSYDWNFFIRPVKDDKTFSGMILNKESFENWRKQICDFKENESRLNADTEISIATKKIIYSEFRFFVVDGKIASHSMYKIGNKVLHKNDMDDEVLAFAERMVKKWQPIDAFVIDIAKTPNGPKVIEINAFGSSGFYDCDTHKIIMAVEDMLNK